MSSIKNNMKYRPHLQLNNDIFEFSKDTLVFTEIELPLGWHLQTEIIRILEGEGEFIISGRTYKVRADSYIIINPNQIHSAHSFIGRPLKYQSLKFTYDYFDNTRNDNVYEQYIRPLKTGISYLPNSILSAFPIHSLVSNIFDELEDNISSDIYGSEVLQKALLYKLIYTFYSNKFVYHKEDIPIKKKSSEDLVRKTISYIHQHYDEEIPLELLSTTLNTTKPHMCRVFKRLTGKTITEYQNNHRIKQACESLVNNDEKIVKIAFDLGYSNISYFHLRFKKKTGLTPNEYRTIYKKW